MEQVKAEDMADRKEEVKTSTSIHLETDELQQIE